MKKVVLFGDSLFAYLTKSPIKSLENLVGDIDVYNCATGGWDSNDVLSKAQYIASLQPDIVVISLGTNDAASWKQVDVEIYKKNLKAIIEIFSSSKVLMFPPPPVSEAKQPEGRKRNNTVIRNYYDAAVQVINDTDSILLDSWNIFMPLQSKGQDYHIDDGVHLNEIGNEVLIQKMAALIKLQ